MSNTNNTMQTQTSNALHNAIMEAGGKDRPPMFAPGNYVHWKSRIKRYIDTKHNRELIHYCLQNPPYEYKWTDKIVLVAEGIDNDIYSTVDACLNACKIWKAIKRLKQGESINVQDLETNLYWEFGKFTSRDGESLESYYSRSQQAATRNRGKAIVNSPPPIYDQEPTMVTEDEEMIVNVVGARENVGTPVVQQSGIQCYNCKEYGHVARECQKPKRAKDAAYHKEKMLLSHYMYMTQIQEVAPDAADNSGPIFDSEPLQKDDDDLSNERDLLASLIKKLKCEIDDSKNRNKFLETSNKALVDKLKGEIEDFKTKNKSLKSSNNHFKEANNELSKTNQLMFKDLKKFQAELDRYHDVKYASKVEIDCAKAKGNLMSYKMASKKSFNEYTRKTNDLNQMILEMKNELFAHHDTISILSQEKAA
nr:hypothetical protein [Tanacetum cinerariifolium]